MLILDTTTKKKIVWKCNKRSCSMAPCILNAWDTAEPVQCMLVGKANWKKVDIPEKKKVSIKIYQQDFIPGFGGYVSGSIKNKSHAEICLNVGALLALAKVKDIKKKELPYFVSETLMHEIVHVLEEFTNNKFDHRKVNALMRKYEKKYRKD